MKLCVYTGASQVLIHHWFVKVH